MTLANSSPDIYEIDLKNTDNEGSQMRGFIIFGEHPREMISPETGLNLLKALCNDSEYGEYEMASTVRQMYHLKLVLNSNPYGRKLVEEGQYCRRQNKNNVDINRNWDIHWESYKDDERQTSSGNAPFSEIETKILRNIATSFKPNVFITIHSGTLGLYTPYAYTEKEAERNGKEMFEIVNNIGEKYCPDCSVGAAGLQLGYLCPGTCLDYIYEILNADYSFAFEIYQRVNSIWETFVQTQFEQNGSRNLRAQLNKKYLKKSLSCFSQTKNKNNKSYKSQSFQSDSYNECFTFFNPDNQSKYDFVVDNWTKAILDTLVQSSQHYKS